MRLVVHGAGAIGGVVGGLLAVAGHEVGLVARGEHLAALRRDGLRLVTPETEHVLGLPVSDDPADVGLADAEAVLLCVKGQQTDAAIEQLAAAGAPVDLPVACLQNGVENERRVLRRFSHVLGVLTFLPAVHLEPGVVEANAAPVAGVLDVGRVPGGDQSVAESLAAALRDAGVASEAQADVMAAKHGKLLRNLANALQVVCGSEADVEELHERLRAEALAVFEAAGIAVVEDLSSRTGLIKRAAVAGRARPGGSTWQSVARDQGSVETDYLNGEIVLLGRLHGVPTPANVAVQQATNAVVRDEVEPGSLTPEALLSGD